MPFKLNLRNTFILLFLLCAIWFAYAWIALHFGNPQHSMLDTLQYYGLAVAGGISLIAAWHNTRSVLRRGYAVVTLLALALSLGAAMENQGHALTQSPAPNRELAQTVAGHLPLAPQLHEQLGASLPTPQTPQMALPPAMDERWCLWFYALLMVLALWQICRKTPERRRFG